MVNWIRTQASIVIVEDPLVSRLVGSVLGRSGYDIHQASASAATELLPTLEESASLLITNRPEAFLSISEHCRLIYLAACPDYNLAAQFRYCRVVHKPFHPTELLSAVTTLLQPE